MNCKQFQKYIPQFIADELNIKDTEDFLEHVSKCRECAEELETMHLLEVGLLQLDSDEKDVSYDFREMLRNKLAMEKKRCVKAHRADRVRCAVIILANTSAVIGMLYQMFVMFGGEEWLANYF